MPEWWVLAVLILWWHVAARLVALAWWAALAMLVRALAKEVLAGGRKGAL